MIVVSSSNPLGLTEMNIVTFYVGVCVKLKDAYLGGREVSMSNEVFW